MKPKDDQILEWVEEVGNMTPTAVSKEGEIPRVDVTSDYAGARMRALARRGLLERVDIGLYTLTDTGRGYLCGEVDAGELEEMDLDETFVEW